MTGGIVGSLRGAVTSPWTITVAAVVVAYLAGRVIVRIARPALLRIAGRTSNGWDDHIVELLASPVSLILALQALRIASPWLPLDARGLDIMADVVAIATTVAAMWMAFRTLDFVRSVLERRSWAIDRPSSRSLLAIGSRFAKVMLFMVAIIAALAELGVSVSSMVAGLGIGGVAVALAAQKTLENLFGALSIGIDQPMREGDFVKVYDFVGHVEKIGLRSTRIRTLDRTIITVPNGDLSNQRIESYAVRDRMRLAATINLVHGTTAQQMRDILADLEAILRNHPKIWPDDVVVRFKQLGASALEVEVQAWFQTPVWAEFQAIRQDVLLDFLAAIEKHGSRVAFPTQTLHIASVAPPPARLDAEPEPR